MLPPFRVKNIISPDDTRQSSSSSAPPAARRSSSYTDGVIRMSKEAYDKLLKRLPEAVLSYIDEEDGEVVLVGSAFELAQRLQDPLPKRPPPKDIHNLGLSNIQPPLHLFDVPRHEYVLEEWRKLEESTCVAREQHIRRKEEKIAFGETSPLSKNAPRRSGTMKGEQQEEHVKRWASYSKEMSFSPFLRGQSELEASSKDKQTAEPIATSTATAEKDITHTTATISAKPTRKYDTLDGLPSDPNNIYESSNYETLGLSPEEVRLQRYDNTANVFAPKRRQVEPFTLQGSSTSVQQQRYTPLLELFQEELSKLGTNTVKKSVDTAPILQETPATSSRDKFLQLATAAFERGSQGVTAARPITTDTPPKEVVQAPVTPKPVTTRMPLPEEGLADSLKSIMAGVGQISAALQQTRAELHATLNIARQDFPHGIQDAVKAGVAAIDALRGGPTQSSKLTASATIAAEALPAPAPVQEKPESWIPERIINRRRILYDGNPEMGDVEVIEYFVHYFERPISDDTWCDEARISVPSLITDFEDDLQLKRQQAEDRKIRAVGNMNKPMRGLSAYMFFANERRHNLVAETPDMRFGEVGRRLGEEWKGLSNEEKAPFERMALDDKKRYEAEKERYEAAKSADNPPSEESAADAVVAEPLVSHHSRGWPSSPSSFQLSPLEPQPYQQRTLWESASLKPNNASSSYIPPPQENATPLDAWKIDTTVGASGKSKKRTSKIRWSDSSSSDTRTELTRPWMESEDKLLIEVTSDITPSQRNDHLYWKRIARKFVGRKAHELPNRWYHIAAIGADRKAKYGSESWYNTSGVSPTIPIAEEEAVPIWAQPAKSTIKSETPKVDEYLQPQAQVPGQNYVWGPPQPYTYPSELLGPSGGALADYQMQLTILEQQNKHRLLMARQEQQSFTDKHTAHRIPSVQAPHQSQYVPESIGSLADYQMQLMLLEQQNKRRLLMARQEQDTSAKPQHQSNGSTSILVPDNAITGLIGHRGQTLRDLQVRSGCRIDILGKGMNSGFSRRINLTGTPDAVAKASQMIYETVDCDTPASSSSAAPIKEPGQRSVNWPNVAGIPMTYDQIQLMMVEEQNRRRMERERHEAREMFTSTVASATTWNSATKKEGTESQRSLSQISNTYRRPSVCYVPSIPSTPQPQVHQAPTASATYFAPTFGNGPAQDHELTGGVGQSVDIPEDRFQAALRQARMPGQSVSQHNLAARNQGNLHVAPALHYPSMLGDRWAEATPPSHAPGVYGGDIDKIAATHDVFPLASQSSTKKEQETASDEGRSVNAGKQAASKDLQPFDINAIGGLTSHPNSGYIAEFGGRRYIRDSKAHPYSHFATDFPAYTRAMHEHSTTRPKPVNPLTAFPSYPPDLSLTHQSLREQEAGPSGHVSSRTFPSEYYPDGDYSRKARSMDTLSVSPIYLRTTSAFTTNSKDFKPPTSTDGIPQPAKYCYKCGIHVVHCRHQRVIALQQLKSSDVIDKADSITVAGLKPYQPGETWEIDSTTVSKAPSTSAPTPPPKVIESSAVSEPRVTDRKRAIVLERWHAEGPGDLSIFDGEHLTDVEASTGTEYIGTNARSERGNFPGNYIKLLGSQNNEANATSTTAAEPGLAPLDSRTVTAETKDVIPVDVELIPFPAHINTSNCTRVDAGTILDGQTGIVTNGTTGEYIKNIYDSVL